MATVSARNITSTSVTVRVTGVKSGDELYFFVRLQSDSSDVSGYAYDSASSTSAEADIGGLEPGTNYLANVRINGKWATAVKFKTDPEEVDFGGDIDTKCTTDSISARLVGINTDYPNNKVRVTFYVAGSQVSSFTFAGVPSSGTTKWMTKTGLKPGTRYSVSIEAEDLVTGWSNSWSDRVTTDKILVSAWSWSSSNGTASASQTKAAYTALTNNGSTSDFSYLVWNDMCSKVIEIENAAGLTWSTKYASYADTKMSSSDKVLTATRFNSLRYNIGRSYSTGINEVASGDTVYAWYFTTLARCMNEWIDQI
nr:MAG TPA: Angiopoietin-1 receptor [Caudoviricetes sp.]